MLATENIYHILNRGTDDRVIFQDRRDYGRFLLTLLECNSRNLLSKNRHRRNKCLDGAQLDHNLGESLIDILCFSLMPNHFHLAVRQLVDNGIAKFMQRVGNSYTKYFNIKHNRKGSLFMSRYKAVSVVGNF